MARKSLRPQLNQIRAWVRQGRTDAWIAHQLGVPASQLRDFRSRHGLDAEGEEPASDVDLRDEIEAEIEAELERAGAPRRKRARPTRARTRAIATPTRATEVRAPEDGGAGVAVAAVADVADERPLEATFDQGEEEGYGIWLDPSIKDDPTYTEHWQGHKALRVTIEPERIVLERVED